MYKTEIKSSKSFIFVKFIGPFVWTSWAEEDLEKLIQSFKRGKFERKVRKFLLHPDVPDSFTRHLSKHVDISVSKVYNFREMKHSTIVSILCQMKNISSILQVFADETLKNEIMREAFSRI